MNTSPLRRPTSSHRLGGRATRSRGVAVPAVALLLALGACGTDDGSADDAAGQGGGTASSEAGELTAQGGELCPARLPGPGARELEEYGEPAASAPEVPAAEEAWVCRYDASGSGWQRVGGQQPVDEEALAAVERDLAALVPAERDRACTQELGPRWMLVTADGEDLTGVVLDDFGCREVRVTSHPVERVAGLDEEDGAVPGVLQAPATLVETLREVGAGNAGTPGGPSAMPPGRWDAMVERLDCDGMPSVFMADMTEPEPGTTLREAADAWARPGGKVQIDSQVGDRAEASVVVDGEVVVVLALLRHPNGGWSVEGGAEC